MPTTILFNKPHNVVSQFSETGDAVTLAEYIDIPGIYPAGRLDKDSEGLMVLTDDGRLQNRITSPGTGFGKTYWAQVEGIPAEADLDGMRIGVKLKDGTTGPAKCRLMDAPAILWHREPPIRVRKFIPESWLEITLHEGRNRQVRRMCASIGFPVLRLIRYRIGSWTLDGLDPGDYRRLPAITGGYR
jgi:23S rRNA pseudouridine2457 synthase